MSAAIDPLLDLELTEDVPLTPEQLFEGWMLAPIDKIIP